MRILPRQLFLALPLMAGCAFDDDLDNLFCETCTTPAVQSCDGTGGDAGSGGHEPACIWDDGDPCNGIETCAADGSLVKGTAPDPDDHDACTDDSCSWNARTGMVTMLHTRKNIDDGDPCTEDSCDPTLGPYHHKIIGCSGP